MKNKKALLVLLISALTLCLTLAFALPNSSKNNQEADQNGQQAGIHPALKQDLASDSGEKILEIIEASYQITENGLDSSSIRVRNLSGKNITALGIIWVLNFTDGGECQIEQRVDYRIHKDIAEAKGVRPFAPYEEKYIPRLTKKPLDEGQLIKEVKVKFSFVEFEDGGGVGLEKSEMYKKLLSQREGAEIYKHWIEDAYKDDPKSIDIVVGRLSHDELPNDKALENDEVKQGALIYKEWMRGILNDRGVDALQVQLHAHQLSLKP
jgi:hypothetical protein